MGLPKYNATSSGLKLEPCRTDLLKYNPFLWAQMDEQMQTWQNVYSFPLHNLPELKIERMPVQFQVTEEQAYCSEIILKCSNSFVQIGCSRLVLGLLIFFLLFHWQPVRHVLFYGCHFWFLFVLLDWLSDLRISRSTNDWFSFNSHRHSVSETYR